MGNDETGEDTPTPTGSSANGRTGDETAPTPSATGTESSTDGRTGEEDNLTSPTPTGSSSRGRINDATDEEPSAGTGSSRKEGTGDEAEPTPSAAAGPAESSTDGRTGEEDNPTSPIPTGSSSRGRINDATGKESPTPTGSSANGRTGDETAPTPSATAAGPSVNDATSTGSDRSDRGVPVFEEFLEDLTGYDLAFPDSVDLLVTGAARSFPCCFCSAWVFGDFPPVGFPLTGFSLPALPLAGLSFVGPPSADRTLATSSFVDLVFLVTAPTGFAAARFPPRVEPALSSQPSKSPSSKILLSGIQATERVRPRRPTP